MKRIVTFLAEHPDIEWIGVRWDNNAAQVIGSVRGQPSPFRVHNVGDIDEVIHYLRCNPEAQSVKFALLDDGRLLIHSVASIADQHFAIEGWIAPQEKADADYVPATTQLREWLDNFTLKLTQARRHFSKQHA